MQHPFSKRIRYRFEQFMAKGGSSIFISLLIAFLVCFAVIVLIRGVILWFIGPVEDYNTVTDFWDHIWYTFLQMTDPGNMYQDSSTSAWIRVTTVIAGFTGVILLSALIAFITTALDNLLYEFRKGRGIILEKDYTLILGWNERVIDILRELIIANESENYASIVVLSSTSKEEMDDFIFKRIPNTKTTKIITSNGDSSNINELRRINAVDAKSIIVMASCPDSAPYEDKLLSDTYAIKTIMAMITLQNGENQLPIITEIFTQQKRHIVNFFDDPNIIALDSWDIMGKLLVQTSLTSGLEMVYNEILSFDLSEVYFHHANWGKTPFGELPYHFTDGVPLGIHKADGTLILRPDDDTILDVDDEILILADDDSTIIFNESKLFEPSELPYTPQNLEKRSKRILILGWHDIGNIFVRESDEYLKEGSAFDVMIKEPSEEIMQHIKEIDEEYPDIKITLHKENTLDIENLSKLNPYTYDNIIILSQALMNLIEQGKLKNKELLA
jgi:ion channel POLLUX/CASTOR